MDDAGGSDNLTGTWTTAQTAARLGIKESAVRKLVERDRLTPVRPGASPLRFFKMDVVRLIETRRTKAERAEWAAIWAEVDAELAGQNQ